MGLTLPDPILAWWKLAAGIILGALLCWPVASCSGESKGRAAEANEWALRAAETARRATILQRAADETLRRAEVLSGAKIASNRQEVDNAVRDIPDQALTPRQRARVCLELRRQGVEPAACLGRP